MNLEATITQSFGFGKPKRTKYPHVANPSTIHPMVGIEDIERAAVRLQGQVLDTPCVESRTLSEIVGAQVFLKFENLQFTASFKERGACNKQIGRASCRERVL